MNVFDALKNINEMAERRLEICRECEHINKAIMQCRKCGCFMSVKTRIPSTSCPIGKWLEEDEINT